MTRNEEGEERRLDPIERVSETNLYEGVRFRLVRIQERLSDGRSCLRDVLRHPGAAVVVALLDGGEVVLVRQHRSAVGGPLLELPAGTLDPGEEPLEAARRELREETGYQARDWEPLLTFLPAPGVSDERMHLFLATSLTRGAMAPDEDEIVEVVTLPVAELRRRVLAGEIIDGKTCLGLLLLDARSARGGGAR